MKKLFVKAVEIEITGVNSSMIRVKVPNGWIIKPSTLESSWTYIPDSQHKWLKEKS